MPSSFSNEIGDSIVASIASEIETLERNRAILKPPNSLDAWEAHHRGLWHMYRFNKADNEQARPLLRDGAAPRSDLRPRLCRAVVHPFPERVSRAGLSASPEIERAYAAAGQSLMADDRDPAAHWAMGRRSGCGDVTTSRSSSSTRRSI